VNAVTGPQYAGFWRRVGASLIDTVIYSLLIGLVLGPSFVNAQLFSLPGMLNTLLALVLTVVLWVRFLGTPGKLLLGCQVVDADTLQPMSVKQSVIRYLGYFVSILPLGLGLLWVARDARKQGFHDKIANTVVVLNADIEADDESAKSLDELVEEMR
jgi:uncharacterized RDD family membrane protein YckC